jgi:ABC-type iron transport system FetAB ATPase subunit
MSSQDSFRLVLAVCGVDRPEAVEEWLRAWLRVRRSAGAPSSAAKPYRGLAPYQIEDAEWCFGRAELVDQLVDSVVRLVMGGGGFHPVVGASGSGKSSLLRAGLLHAIQSGKCRLEVRWTATLLTPGSGSAGDRCDPVRSPCLIVVDQFEEPFTVVDDDGDRDGFVVALEERVDDGAVVVVSIRADFYGAALRYPAIVRRRRRTS